MHRIYRWGGDSFAALAPILSSSIASKCVVARGEDGNDDVSIPLHDAYDCTLC